MWTFQTVKHSKCPTFDLSFANSQHLKINSNSTAWTDSVFEHLKV